MPYLKYDRTLHEISEEKAQRYAQYIDQKVKIPIGYERLDPFKCEILRELPWNWQDYKLIDDPNVKKLTAPVMENKVEFVDKNTVRIKKAPKR